MSSDTLAAGARQRHAASWQRRLAAVLEVLGVFMTGQLIGFLLMMVLGVHYQNPIAMLQAGSNADLLAITQNMALVLVFQYAGIMLLALPIGWWYRRRRLRAYGLTTAGRPLAAHMWTGVVLFALTGAGFVLRLVDQLIPLGAKPPMQVFIYAQDWSDPAFWVLAAVGSFLLVLLLEELFYRGYVQSRLAEDFDALTAILMTAFLFAFSHAQYFLTLSGWAIGSLLALLIQAGGWGYIFYRTKSLIAVIIAHALVNVPVRGVGLLVLAVLMLAVIVLARKPILAEIKTFWAMLTSETTSWLVTLLGVIGVTLFMIAYALSGDTLVLVGVVLLVIALIMEFVEKRRLHLRRPRTEPPVG